MLRGLRDFLGPVAPTRHRPAKRGYGAPVERVELTGAGDDRLNPPSVTPEPAPPDDQLVKLAAIGSVVGAVLGLVVLAWLRRNIKVSVTRRSS